MIKNLENYADILAIPLFALLTYYFYKKQNKTDIEKLLFLFAITGLIADIYFTFNFLTSTV